MANDSAMIDDDLDIVDDSDYEEESTCPQANKQDARKRLEEYLEEKRLRELIDY